MEAFLLHGAWQGRWAWDPFLPHLSHTDLRPVLVDMPGNGSDDTPPEAVSLDLYVAHATGLIAARPGPVALIAHSGAGILASQVAEAIPERIAAIVYVVGMMLPDRMSYADLIAPLVAKDPLAAGIGPHLVWSADRLTSQVPPDAAKQIFYHDCPADIADWAASKLRPQPERGRAIHPRLSPERFGRVPRLYIEAAHDRSVLMTAQRLMQTLVPGADVATLPTGHAPHIAAPRDLAACIAPWLAARATSSRTPGVVA